MDRSEDDSATDAMRDLEERLRAEQCTTILQQVAIIVLVVALTLSLPVAVSRWTSDGQCCDMAHAIEIEEQMRHIEACRVRQ